MATTDQHRPAPRSGATRAPGTADRRREPRPGSWRAKVHRTRPIALAWRTAVFVAGLLCIAGGVALAVLPGPLTIPPVLLGLWVWSTEFEWAHRFFTAAKRKGVEAWQHAREHPVSSTAVTVGGVALVVAAVLVVRQFDLVDRAKDAIGI
jgi:hypothetical protein